MRQHSCWLIAFETSIHIINIPKKNSIHDEEDETEDVVDLVEEQYNAGVDNGEIIE